MFPLVSCWVLLDGHDARAVPVVLMDLDQHALAGVHGHLLGLVYGPVLLHSLKLRLEGEGAMLVDLCDFLALSCLRADHLMP